MKDFGEKLRIANFRATLRQTELWLHREFSAENLDPAVKELSDTLRRYLMHCERAIQQGQTSQANIERRTHKIDRSYYQLWAIMMGED